MAPLPLKNCTTIAQLRPGVLPGVLLAAVLAASLLCGTAKAQALPAKAVVQSHKAKRTKTLPSRPAAAPGSTATAGGGTQDRPVSPYARAAAEHSQARARASLSAHGRGVYPAAAESPAR
jgi:hypothetical protein